MDKGHNSLAGILQTIRDKTAAAKEHRDQWAFDMTDLAEAVYNAREELKENHVFGKWWTDNGLNIAWGEQERAILAKMGANPLAAHDVFSTAGTYSLRMIKRSGLIDERFDTSVKTEKNRDNSENGGETPSEGDTAESAEAQEAEEQSEPEAEEQSEPEAEAQSDKTPKRETLITKALGSKEASASIYEYFNSNGLYGLTASLTTYDQHVGRNKRFLTRVKAAVEDGSIEYFKGAKSYRKSSMRFAFPAIPNDLFEVVKSDDNRKIKNLSNLYGAGTKVVIPKLEELNTLCADQRDKEPDVTEHRMLRLATNWWATGHWGFKPVAVSTSSTDQRLSLADGETDIVYNGTVLWPLMRSQTQLSIPDPVSGDVRVEVLDHETYLDVRGAIWMTRDFINDMLHAGKSPQVTAKLVRFLANGLSHIDGAKGVETAVRKIATIVNKANNDQRLTASLMNKSDSAHICPPPPPTMDTMVG